MELTNINPNNKTVAISTLHPIAFLFKIFLSYIYD